MLCLEAKADIRDPALYVDRPTDDKDNTTLLNEKWASSATFRKIMSLPLIHTVNCFS